MLKIDDYLLSPIRKWGPSQPRQHMPTLVLLAKYWFYIGSQCQPKSHAQPTSCQCWQTLLCQCWPMLNIGWALAANQSANMVGERLDANVDHMSHDRSHDFSSFLFSRPSCFFLQLWDLILRNITLNSYISITWQNLYNFPITLTPNLSKYCINMANGSQNKI